MGNEESHGLVCLIFEPEYLNTLQNLYQWSIVGPDEVDEPKYLISKKLSEARYNMHIHQDDDLKANWAVDGLLRGRVPGR